MDIIKKLTNCTVVSTVKQEDDEAAWLEARTHGIGGSDIGAICGVSPFSSARQIYLKKTGQYEDAVETSEAAKQRMHFGHLLEPVVADEYSRRTGDKLKEVDATFAHKQYPWALANVDRLIVDEDDNPIGILECKTTGEYMNEEWESGEILLSYMYQLQWYLWILGLEKGAIACLVGGNKFYYYEVFRNDALINDTLLPAGQHFWFENVRKLVEPEMQQTDTDFANGLYQDVEKNSEITLESDIDNELAETVFTCKAKIKELTKTMEEAQNRLKDRLKTAEIGYCKDYTVKWSPRAQKRVDTDLLKTEFPDVYNRVLKVVQYRAMSVKGVKV